MATERTLATVLFTDIVGSTERAASLGDEAWHALLDRHHAVVRRWLKRFAGREVKTAGDGFLVVFDGPSRALTCADAIRNSIRELGLEIRCGLHMGEIEHKAGDVGGLAVHIGSRVASLAGPSEVLVSSTVVDAEAGSGFRFEERGRHELKGVPGQWRLHALVGVPEEAKVALLEAVEERDAGAHGIRLRRSHLVRTILAYLGIAALLLFATDLAVDRLGLPGWAFPGAVVLLVLGFAVTAATAWIQSSPETRIRAADGELPGSRALDLAGLAGAIRRGEMPHLTWGRTVAGGVFALSLLFGLAGLYVVIRDRGQSFAPSEAIAEAAPGIAVLPFTVQGAELEVYREGMVDLLSTNLDGAGGLRAIDSRTVLARWNEQVPEGQRADLATSLEVGRRAGARYVLLGSAADLGSSVRLSAELYDVEGGERLGQGQAVGSPDSVLTLVDQLSIEILRAALHGEEGDLPDVNLARATTSSLPALKAYLEGEVLFRRGDFEESIPAYERAVEADSTFAMANWRLATAYGWAESITSELGEGAIDRAVRHADRLPEHEAVLIRADYALTQGSLDGIGALEREVRRRPDDAEGWNLLGETYFHLGPAALIPLAKSEDAFAHATQLDPRFFPAYIHRVDYAMLTADSARAAALIDSVVRLADPTARQNDIGQAIYDLAFGDSLAKERAWRLMEAGEENLVAMGLQDFRHPRFLDVEGRLYDIAARTGSVNAVVLGAWNELHRGRPTAALERVTDPGFPPGARVGLLATAAIQGIPVPAGEIDEALGIDPSELPSDEVRGIFRFFVGAWAADQGREADRAAARGALRDLAARARVEGDSSAARFADGAGKALDGLFAWKRGDLELAEEFLEEARVEATGHGPRWSVNDVIRWWLAEILVEQGKLHEAERYYDSLWIHTMSYQRLGDLYAESGDREKAREAYELFLTAWRDSEPEMQPTVARVRQSLAGLAPLKRE
jgi:class 3 adenylate cyclase/tetratricopeptide (TPR) repeat protein